MECDEIVDKGTVPRLVIKKPKPRPIHRRRSTNHAIGKEERTRLKFNALTLQNRAAQREKILFDDYMVDELDLFKFHSVSLILELLPVRLLCRLP